MTLHALELPGLVAGEKSELLLSPACTILLFPDERSREAFNGQLLSSAALDERQKGLLCSRMPGTIQEFKESLKSLAMTGVDNCSLKQAIEVMEAAFAPQTGQPNDCDLNASGDTEERLETCKARLGDILQLRQRFNDGACTIFKLQEKRLKIEKKLKDLETLFAANEGTTFTSALEKNTALPLLMREQDEKIRLLRDKKENITRKASELKSQVKEFEEYLNASEEVVSIICDYENTEEAIETTLADKEKLKTEISEKEKEIKRNLEIYQNVFKEFHDPQDFNTHMDSLEEKLSEARVMNEKKAELQSYEAQARNLRVTEWLCLIPSTTLILFNFALLYINGLMLDDYLRVVMIMTFMLGICCLAGFIKSFQSIIVLGRTMTRLKQDIAAIRSSIDTAKSALFKMQKHYDSITSTELRVKFKEYQSLLNDLDNVRKLMTVYSSVQTQMDNEKSKLEVNVRTILEKCGNMEEGDEIDSTVIAEFKKNYDRAQELNRENEQVALLYKDVVEEIGREQGKKSEYQKERQHLEKIIKEMAAKILYKDHEVSPELLTDLFLELEEERAAFSDFEAEIGHLEAMNREFLGSFHEMPSLEEEIDGLGQKMEVAKNDRKAFEETLGILKNTTEMNMKELFYPALRQELRTLLEREEWQFLNDKKILMHLCDDDESCLSTEAMAALEISLIYALYRVLLIDFIADGKGEIPLIFKDILSSTQKEHLPGNVQFLLALSKINQVIYVTSDRGIWNSLKQTLADLSFSFKESESGACALIHI
jgi:hypothetical protein